MHLGSDNLFPDRREETWRKWSTLVDDLTNEQERASFLAKSENIDNFIGWVDAFKIVVKQSNDDSTTLKVAEWIEPLCRLLGQTTQVTTGVPASAPISKIVLGAILSTLSAASSYTDSQKGIERVLSGMVAKLSFLKEYQNVYVKDMRLQESILNIYACILGFAIEEYRLFHSENTTGVKRLVTSSWIDFPKRSKKFQADFETSLQIFKDALKVCRDRRIDLMAGLIEERETRDLRLELRE